MLILTKKNLIAYLREHYPAFDTTGPVAVSAVGDADSELPDNGLINYIFQVKNGRDSIIVKQGREEIRLEYSDLRLPPDRNRLEYETLKLRAVLVPQYVPQIFYADLENHIFLMEDVSYLPVADCVFGAARMLPHFAQQCAEYIAACAFYTSEFYLETDKFRALSNSFTNTAMRGVMENWLFLRQNAFPQDEFSLVLGEYVDGDPEVVAQCYLLRHKFMTHTEALIHGDLHTTNIFADEERLKVIDMEYTFAGPCCYDVGYLMNNFISQYVSAEFRAFSTEGDRNAFKTYMLRMIVELFDGFVARFNTYWDRDAKPVYRAQADFRALLTGEFLGDVLGYSAVPGLCRALTMPNFAEFEALGDADKRRDALRLFVVIQRHLLLNRTRYATMAEAVADMVAIEQIYKRESGRT